MNLLRATLGILWASPWSLLGICVGATALLSGGKARLRQPVLQFHGGAVAWLLSRLPAGPLAMTLGHVVLGRTADALDMTHDHELVHVRQYAHWGPFFGPAYLLCSLILWLRGRDPYRDNPFEKAAFDEAP